MSSDTTKGNVCLVVVLVLLHFLSGASISRERVPNKMPQFVLFLLTVYRLIAVANNFIIYTYTGCIVSGLTDKNVIILVPSNLYFYTPTLQFFNFLTKMYTIRNIHFKF